MEEQQLQDNAVRLDSTNRGISIIARHPDRVQELHQQTHLEQYHQLTRFLIRLFRPYLFDISSTEIEIIVPEPSGIQPPGRLTAIVSQVMTVLSIHVRLPGLMDCRKSFLEDDKLSYEEKIHLLFPGEEEVTLVIREHALLLKHVVVNSPQVEAIKNGFERILEIAPQHCQALNAFIKAIARAELEEVIRSWEIISLNLDPSCESTLAIRARIENACRELEKIPYECSFEVGIAELFCNRNRKGKMSG